MQTSEAASTVAVTSTDSATPTASVEEVDYTTSAQSTASVTDVTPPSLQTSSKSKQIEDAHHDDPIVKEGVTVGVLGLLLLVLALYLCVLARRKKRQLIQERHNQVSAPCMAYDDSFDSIRESRRGLV